MKLTQDNASNHSLLLESGTRTGRSAGWFLPLDKRNDDIASLVLAFLAEHSSTCRVAALARLGPQAESDSYRPPKEPAIMALGEPIK